MTFYSPCKCGKFEERDSWVVWEYIDHARRKVIRVNVVVCKNCGRHSPNQRMVSNA